ncbi:phytanoyl-CoA dioxygenase family protein [Marinicrinis sediminis]|uniref:Phytanoyl-CoA dioxygenase family protein n=1 Tax=Marinicrinis sediminis TaxID=1652465 RepID=A0ABW5RF05_9BACL
MEMIISQEQKNHFDEQGYVVLSQALSAEKADDINRAFHRLWHQLVLDGVIKQDEQRPLESLFPRLRDYHLTHSDITEQALSDQMFAIAEALIGEAALAISTSYYFKGPGTRGLPMHQDNYSVGAEPVSTCSVWLSLSATSADNGGLYVVPGSHKLGLMVPESIEESDAEYGEKLALPDGFQKLPLVTEKGDIVAFHGNLLHGSVENKSRHDFRQAHVTHFTSERVEKVSLNYRSLRNRDGEWVRRRLNLQKRRTSLKQSAWSGVGGDFQWE